MQPRWILACRCARCPVKATAVATLLCVIAQPVRLWLTKQKGLQRDLEEPTGGWACKGRSVLSRASIWILPWCLLLT